MRDEGRVERRESRKKEARIWLTGLGDNLGLVGDPHSQTNWKSDTHTELSKYRKRDKDALNVK